MKETIKYRALLALLCLVTLLCPMRVMAAEKIDTGAGVTLTIRYTHEKEGIPGAEFAIYYVATVTPEGKYRLAGDFRDYPVSLEAEDEAAWGSLCAPGRRPRSGQRGHRRDGHAEIPHQGEAGSGHVSLHWQGPRDGAVREGRLNKKAPGTKVPGAFCAYLPFFWKRE